MTLFLVSMGLGLLATALALVAIRYLMPALTIPAVFWPLRMPSWVAWIGFPMTLLGLLLWTLGLALGNKPGTGVRRWGAGLAQWGLGGLGGGWLAGVITSYALQFATGWSTVAPIVVEPKK